jgi:hypothetical protein
MWRGSRWTRAEVFDISWGLSTDSSPHAAAQICTTVAAVIITVEETREKGPGFFKVRFLCSIALLPMASLLLSRTPVILLLAPGVHIRHSCC